MTRIRFLEQGIDTTTSEGRLMYRMLAAIAEFQRDLITANTREGLAAARARSGGRKPKLSAQQVQLAQQLYDDGEKTVAEIAAIFKVPRTTIYGHLDKNRVGARPRSRTATAQGATPSTTLGATSGACPTCGHEPSDARARWQLRQDLTTLWLRLDGHALQEQRHCAACQPHTDVLNVECAECGDGPLITGAGTETPAELWPAALRTWLHAHSWTTQPELLCPRHS